MGTVGNYKNWDEEDIPGHGVIAYDKRHDDVVVYGFLNKRQVTDHQREELNGLIHNREYHRDNAKDLTRQIKTLKNEIRRSKKI